MLNSLDKVYRGFYKYFSLVFLSRIISVVFGILVSVYIGRYYGPEMLGVIAILTSFLMFASTLSLLGLDTAILRVIPEYRVKFNDEIAYQLYYSIKKMIFLTGIFASLILFLFSDLVFHLFSIEQDAQGGVWYFFGCIAFYNLYNFNLKASRTLDSKIYFIILLVLFGLLKFFLLLFFDYFFSSVNNPVYSLLLSIILASFFSFLIMTYGLNDKNIPCNLINSSIKKSKQILKISIPIMMASIVGLLSSQSNVLLLGYFLGSSQVGIYSVSFLFSGLILFIITTLNTLLAPKFSELYYSNRIDELYTLCVYSSKIITFLSFSLFALLVLVGHYVIIFLYGDTFDLAYVPMLILGFGNLFNAVTGSCSTLMTMTGSEKNVFIITIISTFLTYIVGFFLIPFYGIIGASFSSFIATVFINLLLAHAVYKKFGKIFFYIPFYQRVI